MQLPPPDSGIEWEDHKIETPTYDLSPIEKADMSPFLIHMTGKNSIHEILQERTIQAFVPSHTRSKWYSEAVVCFTDSPVFTLDAFRRIKKERWEDDQRYGIGFSKSALVNRGVRPVTYIDNSMIALLRRIEEQLPENDRTQLQTYINQLLKDIRPVMFPLGETYERQGFMWEREWRHSNPEGLEFDFSDIEVICCPEEEEQAISTILGQARDNIKIVQAWDQYDDITSFLEGHEARWESNVNPSDLNTSNNLKFRSLIQRKLSKLIDYEEYLHNLSGKIDLVRAEKENLEGLIQDAENELIRSGDLDADPSICHECNCDLTSNNSGYELQLEQGFIALCLNCYSDWMN